MGSVESAFAKPSFRFCPRPSPLSTTHPRLRPRLVRRFRSSKTHNRGRVGWLGQPCRRLLKSEPGSTPVVPLRLSSWRFFVRSVRGWQCLLRRGLRRSLSVPPRHTKSSLSCASQAAVPRSRAWIFGLGHVLSRVRCPPRVGIGRPQQALVQALGTPALCDSI